MVSGQVLCLQNYSKFKDEISRNDGTDNLFYYVRVPPSIVTDFLGNTMVSGAKYNLSDKFYLAATVDFVIKNKASWLMLHTSGELFIIVFTRANGKIHEPSFLCFSAIALPYVVTSRLNRGKLSVNCRWWNLWRHVMDGRMPCMAVSIIILLI